MSSQDQPDWDTLAEKFDYWLPLIAPVGEALIAALKCQAGDTVLDIASGTGEPALSVAKQNPQSNITGTDAAPSMVRVAQNKSNIAKLKNLVFQAMSAEDLEFPDNSFDKLICRFGVMLFEDPQQGLKEMQRVLKPKGRVALAVWGRPEKITTFNWTYQSFKGRIPEKDEPPLAKASSLSGPGVLETLMSSAGFKDIAVETKQFNYQFQSFDEYWQIVENSDVMKQQFDALPDNERATVRDEVAEFSNDYMTENGLIIPHEYILATGAK
ncbi:class I SAM-dependent methyltransferase [Pseudomonadota bacterium]